MQPLAHSLLQWISWVLSLLIVFFYMWHLAMTVQSIVGGEHRKCTFSEDAYMVAALIVYLDVIAIFMQLLGLTAN